MAGMGYSPFDYVPDFVLQSIFVNLPSIEQFVTIRLVNNRFWNNSPADDRLQSVYYNKSFERAHQYSELISVCGGKWLRKVFFDSNIELITGDILIPFADNCPNIRSITLTNLSDDGAAILPRFGNLKNLKIENCTDAVREALQHLRLVKLCASFVDISDPKAPLVAEPERLRVLMGADFTRPDIDQCCALMTQFIRNFSNLQVLRVVLFASYNGDVDNKMKAMFRIPIIRKFFLNLKHLRFIAYFVSSHDHKRTYVDYALPISCTEFPNLSTASIDCSRSSFGNIDWTGPLISTLPCSAYLRHLCITIETQNASINSQILFAIMTQMPELRILSICAEKCFNYGIFSKNTSAQANLINLRRLTLDLRSSKNPYHFNSLEEFLEMFATTHAPIQNLCIHDNSFDRRFVAPISRFKFLAVLDINSDEGDIIQDLFDLIWHLLQKLRLRCDFNPFECEYFQKMVNDNDNMNLEVAFPRLTALDCDLSYMRTSFCIRPLVQNFVLRLPRLVDFRLKAPIFRIDDGIMKLLACSQTLRHLELNTHEDNAIYFREAGYFLLRDKRRQKISETGMFPGELEIIIIVKNRKEFFKIGGLSDARNERRVFRGLRVFVKKLQYLKKKI